MNIVVLTAVIIIIAFDLLFTLCACILCGREDEYMRRICPEAERENGKTTENNKIINNKIINNKIINNEITNNELINND
jgi:hypothetical protein